MPTLDWLNRDAAFAITKRTPTRILSHLSEYKSNYISVNSNNLQGVLPIHEGEVSADKKTFAPAHNNLLIQGDNLVALKALLPFYRGQVKCIFIDPPYNTGNAFEFYDDNLEHAQWLSMMLPRLQLLRELLREDGFICCHVDDAEGQYIKVLLDEVFGRENYLITKYVLVRYADKTLKQDMDFHKQIEQLHIYRKAYGAKPVRISEKVDISKYEFAFKEIEPPEVIELGGKRVDVFKSGSWETLKIQPSFNGLKEIWASGAILDGNSSGRFFRDYLSDRVEIDGLSAMYKVYGIGDDGLGFRHFTGPRKLGATKGKYYQGVPISKQSSDAEVTVPIEGYLDFAASFGNCRTEGGVEFRSGKKPEAYIAKVLEHFSLPNDIVLDSFLGSGTTAAVAHKMGRRWIGIEMGEHARTHCLPRLQKVIEGEQGGISKAVGWQGGGGFRFATLGATLFDAQGKLNAEVRFADLAAFIWMTETGKAYEPAALRERLRQHAPALLETPYIGDDTPTSNNIYPQATTYYLLYNGILRDKRPEGGNVLTRDVLNALLALHAQSRAPNAALVVYGEACRISKAVLAKMNITFKHIPYDVKAR